MSVLTLFSEICVLFFTIHTKWNLSRKRKMDCEFDEIVRDKCNSENV